MITIFIKVPKKLGLNERGYIRGMRINLNGQGIPILEDTPQGQYIVEETFIGVEARDLLEVSKVDD